MARFVFLHGSWQGAWCWRGIVLRLAAKGHEALALDLPGHGEDRRPPATVTLQDYVDRTIEAVHSSKDDPILVGHSMGGAIISQAAEFVPGRVRALVYVAALVPPNGSSMMKFVEGFDPEYVAHFLWSPDRRTAQITPEGARLFLYSHCPPTTIESALPLLGAEPVAPFETPVTLTEAKLGKVPRYYIECTQDRVVPIALQRAMCSAIPCDGVFSLDTGHSPFFSRPEELVLALHGIAERV
jgi:pimeloyl-ACP methyl ester carboxylesterase